jgi:hypothetical protein
MMVNPVLNPGAGLVRRGSVVAEGTMCNEIQNAHLCRGPGDGRHCQALPNRPHSRRDRHGRDGGTIDETEGRSRDFGRAAQGLRRMFRRNHPAERTNAADERRAGSRGTPSSCTSAQQAGIHGRATRTPERRRADPDGGRRHRGEPRRPTISVKLAGWHETVLRFSIGRRRRRSRSQRHGQHPSASRTKRASASRTISSASLIRRGSANLLVRYPVEASLPGS